MNARTLPVKVKVEEAPQPQIKTCPYVEWYQFKVCTIKSCKNFNTVTPSRCLAVDRIRPEGTKVISDAELNLYKFPESGLSTRVIQIKRKRATDRITSLLLLSRFIEYIKENFEEGGVFTTPIINEAETKYPLNIPKLGWENWMWEYLMDESVWEAFCKKVGGQSKEFPVQRLLAMKLVTFEKLCKQYNLKGA